MKLPLLPIQPLRSRLSLALDRLWRPLESGVERIFGSQYNPLYQSGTLAIFGLLVMIVTGLILFLFYSIEDPYASVQYIHYELPGGQLLRSIHRIAADLSIVAALVHAVRIALQGRLYGPRVLAWVSGLFLLALFLLCGWTGYVMLWDAHGLVHAMPGCWHERHRESSHRNTAAKRVAPGRFAGSAGTVRRDESPSHRDTAKRGWTLISILTKSSPCVTHRELRKPSPQRPACGC